LYNTLVDPQAGVMKMNHLGEKIKYYVKPLCRRTNVDDLAILAVVEHYVRFWLITLIVAS
jgi:hypothetical protein